MNKKIYKKIIIFDLDGTLIDSGHDLAQSLNYALKHQGIAPLPLEKIFSEVGNGVSMIMKKILGMEREHLLSESLNVFLRHYENHLLDNTLPYPGVSETLENNHRHFSFALLTNKPLYLTEIILKRLNLDTFFALTLGGDSLGSKKPDPRGILSILEQTETEAEEAVIVGDSINDVLAGRSSGVEVVGARYGLGAQFFRRHPPDYLIDTFPELFDLVHPV